VRHLIEFLVLGRDRVPSETWSPHGRNCRFANSPQRVCHWLLGSWLWMHAELLSWEAVGWILCFIDGLHLWQIKDLLFLMLFLEFCDISSSWFQLILQFLDLQLVLFACEFILALELWIINRGYLCAYFEYMTLVLGRYLLQFLWEHSLTSLHHLLQLDDLSCFRVEFAFILGLQMHNLQLLFVLGAVHLHHEPCWSPTIINVVVPVFILLTLFEFIQPAYRPTSIFNTPPRVR
jgi:hypothetical protein